LGELDGIELGIIVGDGDGMALALGFLLGTKVGAELGRPEGVRETDGPLEG
jgi:hypothetical protein